MYWNSNMSTSKYLGNSNKLNRQDSQEGAVLLQSICVSMQQHLSYPGTCSIQD